MGPLNFIWRHEWPFTYNVAAEPADPEIFYNEDACDAIKAGGELNDELGKISMERLLGPGLDSLGSGKGSEPLSPCGQKLRQEYISFV